MKMADLKAFVEMKLLSKSEKALEKIGQEETDKTIYSQVKTFNFIFFYSTKNNKFIY